MRKTSLGILALLVVGGVLLWWFWPFGNNHELRLSGVVEIQEVRLAPKIGGRVLQVLVSEGQEIYSGQELLKLDVPEWIAQHDQQRARLEAAMAELDRAMNGFREEEKRAAKAAADAAEATYLKLKTGFREEEKRAAEADYRSAEAERKQAEEEYQRVSELYRTRSVSRAEYDVALSARDRGRGRAEAAKAKHEMHQAGYRKEDIAQAEAEWRRARAKQDEMEAGTRYEDKKLAQAKVAEAKAKLEELTVYVNEATLKAPEGKARVEVISVRPGDTINANQPVIRVLRTGDWWVKVFVPEPKMGHIKDRQPVKVHIDTFPGKAFDGVIEQISNIAEFTPRNVQSVDERHHQVFALKVRVLNPEGRFHAGMAAEVVIGLE